MRLIKSQPLDQISDVHKGMDYFPKSVGFGLGALRSYVQQKITGQTKNEPAPKEENCLSILFINNKALNLEIPKEGNGRSRDGWVEALQSLLRNQLSD